MPARHFVLRMKHGFFFGLNIVLMSGLLMVILASRSEADAPRITPENVAVFQTIVKTKPPLYANSIKPVTIHKEAINLERQQLINLPNYIHYVFEDTVNYSYSTIQTEATFQLVDFRKSANFSGVNFLRQANFTWCDFAGIASFMLAKYKESASYYMCQFLENADLSMVVFYKSLSFRTSKFMNEVTFKGSVFHGAVDFELMDFNENADFSDTYFDKSVSFKKANFKGLANFQNARFGEVADFSSSQFLGESSFHGITLPEYLNLSDISITNNLDLSNILPNPHGLTKLNLLHTDISKIKFSFYHPFKLYFPEFTPEGDIDYVYLSLLGSLRKNGFDESYHQLCVEYFEYQYLKNNHYILNFIDKYWWDYGFDKSRIFIWILGILMFFTILNDIFYSRLIENVYDIHYLKSRVHKSVEKNILARLIHNFPQAFLYTLTLFMGKFIGFGVSHKDFKSNNYFANLYLYVIVTLGIVCVFFIFNSIFKSIPAPR